MIVFIFHALEFHWLSYHWSIDQWNSHIKDAKKSGLVLRLEMAELSLKEFNDEFSYFEIDTENPDKLNPSRRDLAEAVYDKGNDFVENMKMLSGSYGNDKKIKTTRIYVLNPKYVRKEAKSGAIARAGFLYDFNINSSFIADGRDVGSNGSLRGVSRENVATGDETQNLASNKPKRTELKEQEYLLNQRRAEIGEDFSDRIGMLELK